MNHIHNILASSISCVLVCTAFPPASASSGWGTQPGCHFLGDEPGLFPNPGAKTTLGSSAGGTWSHLTGTLSPVCLCHQVLLPPRLWEAPGLSALAHGPSQTVYDFSISCCLETSFRLIFDDTFIFLFMLNGFLWKLPTPKLDSLLVPHLHSQSWEYIQFSNNTKRDDFSVEKLW